MNAEKPEIVKKATFLLWGTVGISVIKVGIDVIKWVIDLSKDNHQALGSLHLGDLTWFVIYLVANLFVPAFLSLLIYQLEKRKNWARWLYVILFVLEAPLSINPLIQTLQQDRISGILGLVQVAAQIVAGVFLFLAPARAWYKKQSQQSTP